MDSMYEILMGLPLFKGVSRQRISEIVGMAKLHFMKYLAGETIITAGSPCTHITFIISGRARVSIKNPDGRFCVSQTLTAPDIISPEYLFGRATTYPCTAVAQEPTGILQISKSDYLKILDTDRVFLFNFLNILSRGAQKAVDGVLALTNGSLRERIAFWIICLSQPGGTDVRLTCRQRDLYSLFGVPRSSLIAILESMKDDGLITFAPNEITVLSRPALLATLVTNAE